MLTRFFFMCVVIFWQYIQIANHYVIHLKLKTLYVNYTSIKNDYIKRKDVGIMGGNLF